MNRETSYIIALILSGILLLLSAGVIMRQWQIIDEIQSHQRPVRCLRAEVAEAGHRYNAAPYRKRASQEAAGSEAPNHYSNHSHCDCSAHYEVPYAVTLTARLP